MCWGYKTSYVTQLDYYFLFFRYTVSWILGLLCTCYITKDDPEFLMGLHYLSGLAYRHEPLYSVFYDAGEQIQDLCVTIVILCQLRHFLGPWI